jgi:hypothetical protein
VSQRHARPHFPALFVSASLTHVVEPLKCMRLQVRVAPSCANACSCLTSDDPVHAWPGAHDERTPYSAQVHALSVSNTWPCIFGCVRRPDGSCEAMFADPESHS